MVRLVVVQPVLLGDEVELHRRSVRQDDVIQPDILMRRRGGLVHRRLIKARKIELLHDGQQTCGIRRAGGPTIGPDVFARLVDVGAADKVRVARHRRELFDVVLDAGDHRIVGAEARRDGDVLAAVPLLRSLVVHSAAPIAGLDAEQVVALYCKLARAVGAFKASLRNAQRRQKMRVQATGLAFIHHDGDEVFLIRLGGRSVGHVALQALRDLCRNVRELAFQVRPGAGGSRVEAVHRERAVFVAGVSQLLDAVAAANVGAKVEQGGIRLVADVPVRCSAVVSDFDSNGPLVVPRAGTAPRSVRLVAEQPDAPAGFDGVVCAHLAGFFANNGAEGFQRGIARHVVHRDLADGLAAGPVAVWADGRVNGQCRITHSRPLPSRSTAPRPFRATESFHPSLVSLSFSLVSFSSSVVFSAPSTSGTSGVSVTSSALSLASTAS